MSFDAKLILAALDKHFDAVEARWDRFFAAQDQKWAKQVVPGEHHFQERNVELPAPESCLTSTDPDALAGVAPATSSSAPASAPAARATNENTTSITPTKCSTQVPTPTPAPINIAAVQLATSSPTLAPPGPVTAPTTWPHAWPAVLPIPAALGAKEVIPTNPPTKCLTECLSHDVDVLKLKSICTAPQTSFYLTDGLPLDINKDYSLKYSQERYITTMSPSFSSAITLLCFGGHEYEKVLESIPIQSTLMCAPVLAYVFHKEKWPPPIQLDMQSDGVQFRPIPWPSFAYWNDYCACCKNNKKHRDFVLWIPWKIPWPFFWEYCVDVHWLHLPSMVFVDYATEVQTFGVQSNECTVQSPWPPPSQAPMFSKQVIPELAIWKCYTSPRKPPWAHQYFGIVLAPTVASWKHKVVVIDWSIHVLIQEERQQKYGDTFGLAWHKDRLWVSNWLADVVMAFLMLYGEATTILLCRAITIVLLFLELLKLRKIWQCVVCLEPIHRGLAGDCFPDGCCIDDLCCCVVLTGCVHMASDINVQVLLIAGELIQEQRQENHNGCGSNANVILSIQQDSIQFCICFTLINSSFMSWVVTWKPPWPLQSRHDISVDLPPIPWPSFREFHEATAEGWCFSLLLLLTWLPSAWWHSGVSPCTSVSVLVSSNPSCVRLQFCPNDDELTCSVTKDGLLESLQVMDFFSRTND